jgi:hypothetical protein
MSDLDKILLRWSDTYSKLGFAIGGIQAILIQDLTKEEITERLHRILQKIDKEKEDEHT